jgi:sugar lactone lactonase YvrE
VTTFAGHGDAGWADGPVATAELDNPNFLAPGSSGKLYVCDSHDQHIRLISDGKVSTLAGDGDAGLVNGPAGMAEFHNPSGVAVDEAGDVYVGDEDNNAVRLIEPSGEVITIAGNGDAGFVNGSTDVAEFSSPHAVALDAAGNIYVADASNQCIRLIDTDGTVSTFAGNGKAGWVDGLAGTAEFNFPTGLAFDRAGNLYVADKDNQRIREVDPGGTVTTLAGSGTKGFVDGPGASADFNGPDSVAVDSSGNVYVTEQYNHTVRMIDTHGNVTTLAGTGAAGFADGPGGPTGTAQFDGPYGVAVDSSGHVYVGDSSNNRVRLITITP